MAIDLARTSFDPARHYSGVASQQGRVSLEAEENEQRAILAEESRRELREIVGVAGTPDDGYKVMQAGGFDLTIGAGTMYVGGNRVFLGEDIAYSDQPDWVNAAGDPEFVVVPQQQPFGNEHVLLVVREYDVTATEDPALREVALGGPDGAARTRLVQRIQRRATNAEDCEGALAEAEQIWFDQGLLLDRSTLELQSASRLRVTWEAPPEPPDPCEPASAGGYLGAENQVIRVQVVERDVESQRFTLAWGWDNASFLYRVTPDASDPPLLTLDRQPVDDHHRPRAGQAVELLPAAAELQATDAVVEGWVAERAGGFGVLTAPYDPDAKTVPFPSPIPSWWTGEQMPQLYLRVWEQLLTDCELGEDVELPGTGLRVRLLTIAGGDPPRVGDHWSIAVRPATPTSVLPARLERVAQPPDGPRTWICPLAVIGWEDGLLTLVDDCRRPFDPLVDLDRGGGGCCTVALHPSDATHGHMQQRIDAAVAARLPRDREHRVTICLEPGRYELDRSIVLDERHAHVHLRGCGEGVVLAARPGSEKNFEQGLIVMLHADNVHISGIEFELPQVSAAEAGVRLATPDKELTAVAQSFLGLYVSIGIRPIHCAQLEVDHCLFRFRVGDPVTTADNVGTMPRNVFAVAIFPASECWGMTIEHNRFLHDVEKSRDAERQRGPIHLLVGLLLGATVPIIIVGGGGGRGRAKAGRAAKPPAIRSLLTDAVVRRNRFAGITGAAFVAAELGEVRIEDNTVADCRQGFALSSLDAQASVDLTGRFPVAGVDEQTVGAVRQAVADSILGPDVLTASVLARLYPLPEEFVHEARSGPKSRKPTAAEQKQWMRSFISDALAPFASAEAEGAAAKPVDFNAGEDREALIRAARTQHEGELRALHLELAAAQRGAAPATPLERTHLHVTGNVVTCAMADDGPTGAALSMMADRELETTPKPSAVDPTTGLGTGPPPPLFGRGPSAIVADNQMSARVDGPAVRLLRLPAAVTGNVIRNLYDDGVSLALLFEPSNVAVTGNVLFGYTLLPGGRPFPPPLDTWKPFNTILP